MICMPCVTWWYSGFPNKLCNVTWGETILKYEKCLQNMNKLIIFHLLKKKKKKKRYGHHILTVNLKSEIKIFKKSNFSWNLMRTLETTYSLQMLYKMCLAWWHFFQHIFHRKCGHYLKVLVEMATMPSGHCSEANPEAYSRVSYESGVRWKRDW